MTFWYSLGEFSRQHCIAICGFLVPANLLATLQTMILAGVESNSRNLRLMVAVASFYAILMGFHVYTWFSIGVVMVPTFILLFLSSVCIGINTWAITHTISLTDSMQILFKWGSRFVNQRSLRQL